MIVRKLLFLLVSMLLGANVTLAQKFTGTAYVHVKDEKGNSRVLNTVDSYGWPTIEQSKSNLETNLIKAKKYDEEFQSEIYYSMNEEVPSGIYSYSGSASVTVKSTDTGKTRVINVVNTNTLDTKSLSQSVLLSLILRQKKYDEEFVSGISYRITTK